MTMRMRKTINDRRCDRRMIINDEEIDDRWMIIVDMMNENGND